MTIGGLDFWNLFISPPTAETKVGASVVSNLHWWGVIWKARGQSAPQDVLYFSAILFQEIIRLLEFFESYLLYVTKK